MRENPVAGGNLGYGAPEDGNIGRNLDGGWRLRCPVQISASEISGHRLADQSAHKLEYLVRGHTGTVGWEGQLRRQGAGPHGKIRTPI